ncbi:DsbC family protein [Marinobacter sp. M-5]|uniref:DsbC family protein n=1 Tax=Marinobacter sp. M-5 TaxID=3081089 RepID=UPI00293D0D15|nr:DsbC family protein [Marinobacter sp. M-5]MDV3505049.1 DsbC family protein [Marinobacter sp. M-5]
MFARNLIKSTLSILLLMAGLIGVPAATAGETEDAIAERLTKAVPGLRISEVRESEAPGLYEVESNNGDTIYTTKDGGYLLTGDLLQITESGIANVSERNRADQRKKQMAAFGNKGLISFPADGEEKAEIAVFTDIDCPYCRKMHDEVPELNRYGITVHYYGFPRSGPNTSSFNKYVSVWCNQDQRGAMDDAKAGKRIEGASCDNPVREQYNLGGQVGVTGTPAIVLEDGNMVRGYVPAKQLAEGLGLL